MKAAASSATTWWRSTRSSWKRGGLRGVLWNGGPDWVGSDV